MNCHKCHSDQIASSDIHHACKDCGTIHRQCPHCLDLIPDVQPGRPFVCPSCSHEVTFDDPTLLENLELIEDRWKDETCENCEYARRLTDECFLCRKMPPTKSFYQEIAKYSTVGEKVYQNFRWSAACSFFEPRKEETEDAGK